MTRRSSRFGAFELHRGQGELRQHGDLVKLAAATVQGARAAGPPQRRGRHAHRDPRSRLARRHVRRLRAGPELLHPPDSRGARRHGRCAAVHRDAAAPRLPVPDAGDKSSARRRSRTRDPPDRAAVPHAAAGSRDRLPGLQPARCARRARSAGLESLVVRSSMAAARFAGGRPDPRTIGAEADVDVDRDRHAAARRRRIRVITQLTDASSRHAAVVARRADAGRRPVSGPGRAYPRASSRRFRCR